MKQRPDFALAIGFDLVDSWGGLDIERLVPMLGVSFSRLAGTGILAGTVTGSGDASNHDWMMRSPGDAFSGELNV